MPELADFIQRVADKTKLRRERFVNSKTPSSFDRLCIVPFFGDPRYEVVFSTMLAHRIMPNDYLIVVSWPGHSGLYPPEVDEFWCVDDEGALSDLSRNIDGMNNRRCNIYERSLLRYFDNVLMADELISKYYNNGITATYLKQFDEVEWVLPSLPSVNIVGADVTKELLEGRKSVFLRPTKYIYRWSQGKSIPLLVEEAFWHTLIKRLLERNYTPILQYDYSTYDVSPEFSSSCLYISNHNFLAILAVMRAADCVLDVFNATSRYALVARCPYFVCDERQRYFATNDYELDDLLGAEIPSRFMFSFAPLANGSSSSTLTTAIVNNLDKFLENQDRDTWPSTVACTKRAPYDTVRRRVPPRIGTRLISVPDLED